SLLDYYGHEQTFYFQHEQPVGRAASLNEILLQCNSPLFWAPEAIQSIDEDLLIDFTGQLQDSEYLLLAGHETLPTDPEEWLAFILQNEWPRDADFILNLASVSSDDAFFNPFMQNYTGLELVL